MQHHTIDITTKNKIITCRDLIIYNPIEFKNIVLNKHKKVKHHLNDTWSK